jgi:hypothetical protein
MTLALTWLNPGRYFSANVRATVVMISRVFAKCLKGR